MPRERWRPVLGYEGLYEVSDRGRVRSLDREVMRSDGQTRTHSGRVLVLSPISPYGHQGVGLYRDRRKRTQAVHRLVLEAFEGPAPGLVGCHGNGNPADNRLANLRWDTQRENMRDKFRHGRNAQANKTHCPSGHPYAGENLLRGSYGRRCRACARDRYHRLRAAA